MKWKRPVFKKIVVILGSMLLILLLLPIPDYTPAKSKILYDRNGEILSATISSDQQWCFELEAEIPRQFEQCLLLFEDEYFYFHPGINPVSIIKAAILNIRHRRIVRGGSTLTMQLMRMKNRNARRNFFNKIREALSAVKYTMLNSKKKVIREWAEVAPFGGNTIGITAAAMRYFNKPLDNLSWAEYALLAVMPHSPAHASLTKNRDILQKNRDFLLNKLAAHGLIPPEDLPLYLAEDLPEITHQIPVRAFHLLNFLSGKYSSKNIFHSTVDKMVQDKVIAVLDSEKIQLQIDGISNAAVVVLDIESDELLAYIGNNRDAKGNFRYVDIIQSPRSYGSLLKPLLYAHALETGRFLPKEILPDIPLSIADFRPANFDKKYRGAVGMDEMLIQSLNVPSVWLLYNIGLPGFYQLIQDLKIGGINKGVDHYGLSLILGGGESTLWEMARLYKGFARNYLMMDHPFSSVQLLSDIPPAKVPDFRFSPTSISHTVHTMADVVRPREEKHWQLLSGGNRVAWKTGTSYGHRDAWAIGFNGKYLVGVWIGNESGEGRHNLTGIVRAAPVMFRIFNSLPENKWFARIPAAHKNAEVIKICKESGKLAGKNCTHTTNLKMDRISHDLHTCKYHKLIHISQQGFLINPDCKFKAAIPTNIFLLPPTMDYYYRQANLSYKGLPQSDKDCPPYQASVKIVYPENGMKLFIPKNSPESTNQVIAVAHHPDKESILYWFVNNDFITETQGALSHRCTLDLPVGSHTISVTDSYGNSDNIHIQVLK